MTTKNLISAFTITAAVVLGVFIGSNYSVDKEQWKQDQKTLKQNKIEIAKLKESIGQREKIVADGVKTIQLKDSLYLIEQARTKQAQELFLRERKLRLEQLKQLTNKEKEDIIIKRYQ